MITNWSLELWVQFFSFLDAEISQFFVFVVDCGDASVFLQFLFLFCSANFLFSFFPVFLFSLLTAYYLYLFLFFLFRALYTNLLLGTLFFLLLMRYLPHICCFQFASERKIRNTTTLSPSQPTSLFVTINISM